MKLKSLKPPRELYMIVIGLLITVGAAANAQNYITQAVQSTAEYLFKPAAKTLSTPHITASSSDVGRVAAEQTDDVESEQIVEPDYTIPPIEDGLAPVLTHIPTKQPVVFLGIDDGATRRPNQLKLMTDNHVKASLFLADIFTHDDPDFFKGFIDAGSLVENHTLHHDTPFSGLNYEQQKAEICGQAELLEQEYGRRPVLFRPPGGDYNEDTQRAAADCGMKAVVNWIAKANGGSMQYQYGDGLLPGDIVLMHFRPEFAQDMQAFLDAQNAAGLHTELLEDWLAPQ